MATSFAQFGNELYTGKRSYNIVGNRKRWFAFAGALVVLSILLLTFVRLNPGIEFRGGSEFQVANVANVDQNLAYEAVETVATTTSPASRRSAMTRSGCRPRNSATRRRPNSPKR